MDSVGGKKLFVVYQGADRQLRAIEMNGAAFAQIAPAVGRGNWCGAPASTADEAISFAMANNFRPRSEEDMDALRRAADALGQMAATALGQPWSSPFELGNTAEE